MKVVVQGGCRSGKSAMKIKYRAVIQDVAFFLKVYYGILNLLRYNLLQGSTYVEK